MERLLLANETQRDANGFFVSPSVELSTDAYAFTSTEIDLGSRPGDWLPSGRLATVRLDVSSVDSTPVFVGIGPDAEVGECLDDVSQARVARIGPGPGEVSFDTVSGGATPARRRTKRSGWLQLTAPAHRPSPGIWSAGSGRWSS